MRRFVSLIIALIFIFCMIQQVSFASLLEVGILPSGIKVNKDALTDISVTTSVTEGVYFSSITNGTGTLAPGNDYIVSKDTVKIKKSYLKYYFSKFPDQNLYLSFNFSDGTSKILTVYMSNSSHPEFAIASECFNPKEPSDLKFPLKLEGNFITLIEDETESLIQKVDYTYSNGTGELILRKGYLESRFKKSLKYLSFKVHFTGGDVRTIVVISAGNGFKAVAAGENHTVALWEDGTVTACGMNDDGQCDVPKGLGKVKDVAAGAWHTAVLKEDGTVVAWGFPYAGVCDVPKDLTGVKTIASGDCHLVALEKDGSVATWGGNYYGQCDVPKGLGKVLEIAAGPYHTAALREDGTVAAWGDNGSGQCNVPKGLTGVKAIAATRWHTLALKEDGSIIVWGNRREEPYNVPNGLTGVKAIAAGYQHALALKEDGTVAAWGNNIAGQCNVPEGLTKVKAISCGEYHSVALREDGTIVSWGSDSYGQCDMPVIKGEE